MNRKIAVLLIMAAIMPFMQMVASGENQINGGTTVAVSSAVSGTHTVFLELGTLTTCPYCPSAVEALEEITSEPPSPFYYVTLVYDKSDGAMVRGRQLKDMYVPMLYVDGGYQVVEQSTKIAYENAINEAANRNVHDIDMALQAAWNNGNIDITINIDNHGGAYLGRLRLYIVEKNSRWIDSKGDHFVNALMDYRDNFIFIGSGATKNVETTWDNTYNLEEGNAMVVATLSYWIPKVGVNPPNPWYYKYFLAYTVDECAGVEL